MNTDRIKKMAKSQGKTVTYICSLIDRPKYYLNDVSKPNGSIPDEYLRTIAINLNTSVEYLKGETDDPVFHLSTVGKTTFPYEGRAKRPILGHASAGLGVVAEQEILGYEFVDDECHGDDFFWLQVDGDSMSPVLANGDLVLVQKDTPLESGSLMVVIVDDTEGFIKKVFIDDDSVTLQSFNPYYPPKVFGGSELGRLRFVGKVVEQKRTSW